ncbi:hypothetical protein ACYJ2U_001607 [Clostridium botulinum]
MIKAELIDKRGYPIAIVRQVHDWTHSFGGFITLTTSWNVSTNEVGEEDFLATCSIKWDGCSHFGYNGQDYLFQDTDCYYHECGLNEYYKVFVAKLLAFEVAKHYMKDTVKNIEKHMDNDLYDNTIDKVNILDFYTIEYSEIDEENDFVYQLYLEKENP